MDRSYSYSQLSAAYRCNKYYKLLYVDKLVPKVPKNSDLFFGTCVHHALAELLVKQLDPVKAFMDLWLPEAPDLTYGRYDRDSLEIQAKILLERFERLHAKKIKVHQSEVRLYGQLDGIKLEGTPDILGDFEDTPSVIDFKTSGFRYPKEKVFLNEQMYLYACLALQNQYKAEQIVYMVLIKGTTPSIQVVKRQITQDEMKNTLANIVLQCQALEMSETMSLWSQNRNSCLMGERKCDMFNECWKGYVND